MNQTAETCTIAGTTYTVEEYAQGVPVIELKMMSDYKWQLRCLQSRLQHPELYDGEDVQQTTAKLCAVAERTQYGGLIAGNKCSV